MKIKTNVISAVDLILAAIWFKINHRNTKYTMLLPYNFFYFFFVYLYERTSVQFDTLVYFRHTNIYSNCN